MCHWMHFLDQQQLDRWLNGYFLCLQVLTSHQMDKDLLGDYCDGSIFKSHPLFSADPKALQIMLYYDNVEVVNPKDS